MWHFQRFNATRAETAETAKTDFEKDPVFKLKID